MVLLFWLLVLLVLLFWLLVLFLCTSRPKRLSILASALDVTKDPSNDQWPLAAVKWCYDQWQVNSHKCSSVRMQETAADDSAVAGCCLCHVCQALGTSSCHERALHASPLRHSRCGSTTMAHRQDVWEAPEAEMVQRLGAANPEPQS